MHKEQKTPHSEMKELPEGIKFTLLISLAFFGASLFGKSLESWPLILKISLGYGFSIYGMIWLSYATAWRIINFREQHTGKDFCLGFWGSFAISFVGLTFGALLAEWQKAFFIGADYNLKSVPFIIVIGSFISLMFIYRDQNKQSEKEKNELNAINELLKSRQEKEFLTTLTANLGNTQKIISVDEVLYFKSMDHYTHACTREGEHIIDFSLKKLAQELDPSRFVQIHRNCIVALSEVASIENGNQWFVKTKSGEELKVSRNSRKRLKDCLSY
jgi:hypothetical protein